MEQDYDYEKMANEGYECDCESAGFCPLLATRMDERLHNFCKTDPKYREYFLETARRMGVHDREVKRQRNERQKEFQQLHSDADSAISELKEQGVEIEKISEGLGDTIEKVLNKFGITQEKIEKITGAQGCGCSERKKWFNKIFSYKKEDTDE
jgi:hypothetical protein